MANQDILLLICEIAARAIFVPPNPQSDCPPLSRNHPKLRRYGCTSAIHLRICSPAERVSGATPNSKKGKRANSTRQRQETPTSAARVLSLSHHCLLSGCISTRFLLTRDFQLSCFPPHLRTRYPPNVKSSNHSNDSLYLLHFHITRYNSTVPTDSLDHAIHLDTAHCAFVGKRRKGH
jgi:hypothetical protein